MPSTDKGYDVILDLSGLSCPGPLVGAKKMIDTLEPGQVLKLVSDCPGTHDDLVVWARQTGNQLLRTEKQGTGTCFFIQKGITKKQVAQVALDIRGVHCPGPIVEAKKLLNGMRSGEVLELISNCPGIRSDIVDWAEATHMKILETLELTPGDFTFYIQKK